ncbi:MAG TPA: ribonuclease H [Ktedonobacteraceae bacterium]|jgi:ribonuclease HI
MVSSNSLEWQSVLKALADISVDRARTLLGEKGTIAYTDGACIKNPGGPAGWSAILVPVDALVAGEVRAGAGRIEAYGHIPRSPETTNNRAEISAFLAALLIAPRACPLTIFSDSEYSLKTAQGLYKGKANPDLWDLYRVLSGKREAPTLFEWVRGHAGHTQNERADELAGLGAWNNDKEAYRRWQASALPEARNAPAPADLGELRQSVERLNALLVASTADGGRMAPNERTFLLDMGKRFRKRSFVPSPAQCNWIRGLAKKYRA